MKKIIALFVILVWSHSNTFAQNDLKIKVLNSASRRPLQNTVFTVNQNAQVVITDTTDTKGNAIIKNLPVGIYTFKIEETDKLTGLDEIINILADKNKERIFLLQDKNVASLDEVIIANEKRQINRTDAQVSSFITRKEIELLPIEGRDITRSLYRLPNLTISTLGYNEAPNVAINGLTGIYTNYLIDGMDNNERFLGNVKFNTPVGFTESVTVLTNNYSAEFGNTSTGIVNLSTRSGSNNFSGEVFYLTRPGKVIDSKSAFAGVDLYGNPVKDGFQRQQLGIGLGGAIKKDKTFYYLNAEQTFDIKDNLLTVPQLGVNETVRGNNSFTYLSGKIDQYWSSRFHSSLRGNVGIFDIEQQGGGLTGGVLFPSAGSTQKNRTYLVGLKNDYKISDRLQAETNFQTSFFRWNYRDNKNFGKPGASVQAPNGTLIASVGPIDYIFDDDEYTNQLQQKFSYQAGKHALKAGVEFTTSDFKLLGAGNSNGFYTVRLTQFQMDSLKALNLGAGFDFDNIPANVEVREYRVDLDQSTFGVRQNVLNVYVEDNIAVNAKLNLSAGLRFDYDNLSKAGSTKGDWNNFGPRTSFNYKIDENNIIRGGYGIFYDKIKYSVTSDNLQFSNNSDNFKRQLAELQRLGILSPTADLNRITHPGNLRAIYNMGSTPAFNQGKTALESQGNRATQSGNAFRIKNPDGYQNPYSHQYTIGYQRKVTEEISFVVDLVASRTNNLYRIKNLNTASSYELDPVTPVVRTQAAANATRPVPISTNSSGQLQATIGGQTFTGIARDVFMTETKGKARYYAANFVLQKSKTSMDKYSYRISYSLSQVKTDAEGINVRATNANDWDAEYAYGDNDRTHVLNALITWYPIRNLTLTPAMLFQSGQPLSRYADATKFGGMSDLNGNGENAYANAGPADYQPGETRNNDRLPSATTFDFSAKYKISINGKPAIEISADIYNLLNTENLSGFNVTKSASNQVQLGPKSSNTFVKRAAAPPRQFQFGVRYIW
ncbi:MAG: TonB-dependent receptor [Gloeobacteraceae cyanobacterium ES-bin-316]|nr:TonB-dependent receptor [Ferruginibacter sp.]